MLILLCIFANFSTDYRMFIESPRSESVFVGLTRGDYQLADFSNDPVVLWFWRNSTESPLADSLLKRSITDNYFYLSALLRWEAREQADPQRALEKLRLAVHLDTTAIENVVSLAGLYARQRQYGKLVDLLNFPLFENLRNQVFFITNAFIGLILIVFLSGCVYIIVKMAYYLPVLSHRLDPIRHTPFKNILPLVILLVPILVLRNLLVIYAAYGLILALIGMRREKNWLRFNIIALIVLFIASVPASNFIEFLNGNGQAYQMYRLVNFNGDLEITPGRPEQKELLAYTLKQQGALEEAMSIYEELYYQGNHRLDVLNNLANIYAAVEEDARAESLYLQATRLNRPEPYFNLGLLKLKNIEYLESSKYMEEARQRGFSSLSKTPIDIGPANRDYYALLLDRHEMKGPLVHPLLLVPLLLIFIASLLPIPFPSPLYCSLCGQPVCPGCVTSDDAGAICADCDHKMKTGSGDEDIRDLLQRRGGFLVKVLSVLLNLLMPGAGLIYMGKNFAGLVIVAVSVAAWIPVLFRSFFVKPAGWITLPLGGATNPLAIIVIAGAYVLSFLMILETYAARRRSQEF